MDEINKNNNPTNDHLMQLGQDFGQAYNDVFNLYKEEIENISAQSKFSIYIDKWAKHIEPPAYISYDYNRFDDEDMLCAVFKLSCDMKRNSSGEDFLMWFLSCLTEHITSWNFQAGAMTFGSLLSTLKRIQNYSNQLHEKIDKLEKTKYLEIAQKCSKVQEQLTKNFLSIDPDLSHASSIRQYANCFNFAFLSIFSNQLDEKNLNQDIITDIGKKAETIHTQIGQNASSIPDSLYNDIILLYTSIMPWMEFLKLNGQRRSVAVAFPEGIRLFDSFIHKIRDDEASNQILLNNHLAIMDDRIKLMRQLPQSKATIIEVTQLYKATRGSVCDCRKALAIDLALDTAHYKEKVMAIISIHQITQHTM